MPQLRLITQTKSQREKQRARLLKVIKKLRVKLNKAVVRNEMLKVEIEMLKREYMVKIGSLLVKDNHIDLEIIRYRNIITHMEQGMTYAQASEEIAKTFYAQQLEIESEEETIHVAQEIFEKSTEEQTAEMQAILKKLWRSLVRDFHPDLTQDPDEKKRREEIMIQINLAFEEGDTLRLEKIKREQTVIEETSLEDLQDVMVKTENEIMEQEKLFFELKQTEWYAWLLKIKKSKKTFKDIFHETEKNLLNNIVAKLDILKKLRQNIEKLEEKSIVY